MRKKMLAAVCAGAVLAGTAGQAGAQDQDLEQMRREMAQMRAELNQLKAREQGDWMNEKRKAEIQALFDEAMANAEKREGQVLAGIDEKGKIFLRSEDNSFKINFNGQIQFRYIWNNLDDATAGRSDSLSGFQARRMKFGMSGNIGEEWGYKFVLATARGIGSGSSFTDSNGDTGSVSSPANGYGAGDVFTEDVYITYDFGSGFSLLVGVNKLPFARQEIISSTRQVGVDRSLATEFFTLNRADQATLIYENDDIIAQLALSDGGNDANFTEFSSDVSNDFALTARVDWMVIGKDWGAMKHEFAGVENDALFLGGAVHYEVAEGGGAPPVADSGIAWTVDALFKTGDIALSAAVFGNHTHNIGATDTDQYGVYTQADYKIGDTKWDVFGRYEWIDDDGVDGGGGGQLQAITLGANHHFNKNVKFTADVVWLFEGDDLSGDGNFINGGETSSGLGLSSAGFNANQSHGDQVALRFQLQLLF